MAQPSTESPARKPQKRPQTRLLLFGGIFLVLLFTLALSWKAYVLTTTTSAVDVIRKTSVTSSGAEMELIPLNVGASLPSSADELRALLSINLSPSDVDEIWNGLASSSDKTIGDRNHPQTMESGILKIKMNGGEEYYVVYSICLEPSSNELFVLFESGPEGSLSRYYLKQYESEDQQLVGLLRRLGLLKNLPGATLSSP